ncbi:uncharacterized protein [Nicotiana sylvestris]|uniref:uncharacterized protein n=1 Tax=Nicotiana sylvestris TaxID=4096 RepID=UPI00388C8743
MGFLQPVPQTRHNPASPAYKASVRCAYHSGAEGHDTNDCWTLRREVENLIEQGKIVLRDEEVPNVTNNPLPAHNNGSLIGIICEDKEFDPALKAIIAIVDIERKPKEAPKQEKGEKKTNTVKAELEKKAGTKTETMLPSKNEVLYIPRGRSEKPQRFEIKRAIPMYVSKGAYVVRGTIKPPWLNELVVIGRVPQKPMTDPSTVPWNYQQTLVTYKGKEITGKLPENTSAGKYSDIQEVNNATRKRFPPKKPVSTEEAEVFFQKMNMPDYEVVDQLRNYPEQVSMLSLLMRSAEHQKILLKTLNEAYVLAETLVEQLERMTEREDEQSIYRDPSIPYLEAREGFEHTDYQAFEVVLAEQYKEGSPCPQPFLSNVSIMVAKEMIRQGFKPGKGLGKSLQGITEPITLPSTKKLFGIGFQPAPKDEDWAKKRKNEGWKLPQPFPHLYETFVRPKYIEEEDDEAFTAEEIEEICGAMREMLYETHMVQLGEGTSTAEVLYMGPNVKLQNWEATPFPVRQESGYNSAALNNMTCLRTSRPDPNELFNCEIMNQEPEYDEEEAFREINLELEHFDNKPMPNLNDTEPVNLGTLEEVRETKISIHTDEKTRNAIIQLLFELKDVFAWSYDDMLGLGIDLVVHKLPIYPGCPPVQQKQRKFKTDISDKIKEEITK